MLSRRDPRYQMASGCYKASPPFLFPSTQQQVLLILLLCLAFMMMPFVITSTGTSNTTFTKGCIKEERDALLAFKDQIIYHNVHPISSWGHHTNDCCHWPAVRCDNISGHVVRLNLQRTRPRQKNYDYDYYGFYPKCDEWDLSGNISESLIGLRHLTYLDLSGNCFLNISIPELLGSLENLVHLDLRNSDFTGVIPHELGNLTRLRYLNLATDVHRLKVGDAEWLSGLSSLRYLLMDGVNFSGVNNVMQSLNKLRHLKNVSLSSCEMNSIPVSLPHLNFTSLTFMDIAWNMFDDVTSIPEWLFKIPNLRHLSMEGCGLTGTVPSSVGNATSLQYLDLSYCHVGPKFPLWLTNQENLQDLEISNAGIKDSIPDWFWNITYNLSWLDLSNNEINGRLPHHLKFQAERNGITLFLGSNRFEGSIPYFPPNVYALDLSNNSLSGSIPSDLGNFGGIRPQLTSLILSANNLTGSIPNSLCNLVGLVLLELSNNHLEGAIPNCWNNLTSLQYLILANNSLVGEVPNSLVSCQFLQVLHLSNNQLHGEFPSFLKKSIFMTTLTLDHNNLSGKIPSWVGESMTALMILTLKENNFSGNLPLLSNLTSLHFLDLSHNSFVGSIPQSYGNLMGMINGSVNGGANFPFERKELVIKIIILIKGSEIQFGVALSSLKFIDLSANNLSGQIPKEIVNLVGLHNLDLSYNTLSGEIPSDIGRMKSLESLDLSRNEFIGSIPTSLFTLDFLESLNLSHNNLSGKIPYASQLTGFNDPSIYAGNLNLCGAPLDKNCTSDESTSNSQFHDQDDDKWFCIGLMTGFDVGFWIVWITLLIKKEWRYAYFRFMDHMYDMVYVKIVVTIAKIKRG